MNLATSLQCRWSFLILVSQFGDYTFTLRMLRFQKSIFDGDPTLTTDPREREGGRLVGVAGPVEKRDITKQRSQKSVSFRDLLLDAPGNLFTSEALSPDLLERWNFWLEKLTEGSGPVGQMYWWCNLKCLLHFHGDHAGCRVCRRSLRPASWLHWLCTTSLSHQGRMILFFDLFPNRTFLPLLCDPEGKNLISWS